MKKISVILSSYQIYDNSLVFEYCTLVQKYEWEILKRKSKTREDSATITKQKMVK